MTGKWKWVLPGILVVLFGVTRWPGLMPAGFTAAYALAFCAGVFMRGWTRWLLPLVTIFLTDLLINRFAYQEPIVGAYMIPNYLLFAGLIWFGSLFSQRSSWLKLVGGGLLAALIFYLVSNTFAWLSMPEYSKSFSGWVQALTTGLPGFPPTWTFFKHTLLSGGLFTGLFAGAIKAEEALTSEEEETESTETPSEGEAEEA